MKRLLPRCLPLRLFAVPAQAADPDQDRGAVRGRRSGRCARAHRGGRDSARACRPMSWWRTAAAPAACSRSIRWRARRADGRTILFASVGAFVITNALKPQPGYDQLKVLRAGRAHRRRADVVHREGGFADQDARRPDRQGEGRQQDELRLGRRRHHDAHRGRAAQSSRPARKITHVPYRGIAPALNDIMGGHIDFLNGDITVLYPLVTQGTIRALAVAGTQRSALLPDVPTAQELGFKDVYMENWYGALVPAATPPDVVAKLEAAIMDALKNPDVWAKISANGVYGPQDAKAFRAQIEKDVAYWSVEIKKLGIRGSRRVSRAQCCA